MEAKMLKPKTQGLNRKEKEAIALLSIGTLLEYFDLMLYVHLSVLLNDLFFPKTDPTVAKLLGATAFCSTFVLRPVGGYIIGKIGDQFGRKTTIMITTTFMAGSCLTMAMLPEYKEIGISATVIIILCRVLQGFSSLGEIIGAGVYLLETLKSPYKYISNGIIEIQSRIGGFFALGVATLVLNSSFNWRYAFLIGAAIAFVGVFARTRLRETAEFANYKSRIKLITKLDSISIIKEKVDKKVIIAMFFGLILDPFGFYMSYIYLGDVMKEALGMTAEQVITHNFKFSVIDITIACSFVYLYKFIHPINIIKTYNYILIFTLALTPYCIKNINTLGGEDIIYILQVGLKQMGAINLLIYFKHFPISKRFTTAATMFGISVAAGFAIISYGLTPIIASLGYYGIWMLYTPFIIGMIWGLNYTKNLETKKGDYYNYPYKDEEV